MEASVFFQSCVLSGLSSSASPFQGVGLTIRYPDVTEQNGERHGFASLQKVETGSWTQKSCVTIVQGSHLLKTVSCCQD